MSHVVIHDPIELSARFSNRDRLGFDPESDFHYELRPDADAEFSNAEFSDGFSIEQELSPREELLEIRGQNLESNGKKLDFSAIAHYLRRIPKREADLITLYHKDRMKQEQIAKLFCITQAAVSYRLHRGIRRIQFLRTIPELDRDIFELELGPKFSTQDLEILWRMYETTCQSEIAKQMGLTQGRVRHRFFRALSRIKELIEDEAREKRISLQMESKKRNGDGKPAHDAVWWTPEAIQMEVDKVIKDSKYGKYWTVYFAISDKHFNILHEVSLPQFKDRGDAQILPID
jgi:DNA-directed RNA polymerase specialized sigma24 family protein